MKNYLCNRVVMFIICILILPNMLIANDDLGQDNSSFNNIIGDESATKELTKLLNNITTMNANFTQIITNRAGYTLQEQAGVVQLVKPNLLHWQVLTPDHILIISDGEKIWNYDLDLEQVTVKKFSSEINNTKIANLLFGDAAKTLENFYVTSVGDLHFELNSSIVNNLEKRKVNIDSINNVDNIGNNKDYINENNTIEDVFVKAEVLFNKSNKLIMLRFYDQLDQETTINFSKFKNQVNRNIFKFKIPDGVDVVEN